MKKYIQLYEQLLQRIEDGVLAPGARLPSEEALAANYGVSRQTVRQALALLKQEQQIFSLQGSGSFVAQRTAAAPKTKRIAVISTYLSEYIFPSILRGISDTAARSGFTVEINTTNNSLSLERNVLATFSNNPVAGIIVEGTKSALPNPNIGAYLALARQGIPIVFINGIYKPLAMAGFVSVLSDDCSGGDILANMAIDLGFCRIGVVMKSDDAQGLDRFTGIITALTKRGVEFDDRNFVWYTTETRGHIFQGAVVEHLIETCNAILCYNDEAAALLVPYLNVRPHSVRFIGSFDANISPYLFPDGIRFFSLEHPKAYLGQVAAQKLLNMIGGQPETSTVIPWNNAPADSP